MIERVERKKEEEEKRKKGGRGPFIPPTTHAPSRNGPPALHLLNVTSHLPNLYMDICLRREVPWLFERN